MNAALASPGGNGHRKEFTEFLQRQRGPGWLDELRQAAFDRFSEQGFPTTADEAYRFTDLAPLAKAGYTLARPAAATRSQVDAADVALPGSRIVLVNGRHAPEHSTPPPEGVAVTGLREALAAGAQALRDRLAPAPSGAGRALADLNTAFLDDGLLIDIAPGATVAAPVRILCLTLSEPGPSATHPRIVVSAGARSQAAIVEIYAGGGATWTNAVTQIDLAGGAHLQRYRIVREDDGARHVSTTDARVGRDAHFTDHNYTIGASLVRNDLDVVLSGPGAEATLNGLYLLAGTQHVDNHTSVDHAVPHTTSREFYKGVLDGTSRGVFYGKVLIRKDAQKSNASQTNKNLILSKGALVDSIPALEISADDVKAAHGSTIGQLDPNAVFYLRARGIDAATAKSLLTYAFARDVVDQVALPELRAFLDGVLLSRLPNGPKVREVLHETQA